jgi:hypothetical protein
LFDINRPLPGCKVIDEDQNVFLIMITKILIKAVVDSILAYFKRNGVNFQAVVQIFILNVLFLSLWSFCGWRCYTNEMFTTFCGLRCNTNEMFTSFYSVLSEAILKRIKHSSKGVLKNYIVELIFLFF